MLPNTVMTAVEHFSEQSQNVTMPDTPQLVSLYWVLELLNGIGEVVAMFSAVEFTMAQTPNRIRGIMMGLVIAMIGWSTLGSYRITKIFKEFTQQYFFYCYLALPPLAILMLIIFLLLPSDTS